MAFASSRIGAQEAIIKPCDLCDDEEIVNWFCKDCVQNLCDRCQKMHLKTTTCRNHRLVSILDGVAITKKNVSNICQEHNDPFTFLCRTCEENICSMCLSLVHKEHDFIDLRNLQSELHNTLDCAIEKKEIEQTEMTKNMDELGECAVQCRNTLKQRLNTIDDRVNALHIVVEEERQKLKECLTATAHKQLSDVEERKQKVSGKKMIYSNEIQAVKRELTLQTTTMLNHFVETSTAKLQTLTPTTFPIPLTSSFTPGIISRGPLRDMIGKTEGLPDMSCLPKSVKEIEFDILSKLAVVTIYELNVQDCNWCSSICTSPDGSIWVSSPSQHVYKMSSDGSVIVHQIKTRSWGLKNIVSLQSGDVVGSYGSLISYVDRFTSDGERKDFNHVSQMYAEDLDVTNQNEVVVGVTNKGCSSINISALVKFSKEGKRIDQIKMEREIGGFCINKDGNYVTSEVGQSCLTTLDRSGSVLKKQKISHSNLFRLRCDRYGNILGVPNSYGGKIVYLISEDGKVERSFHIECDRRIHDICLDSDDRLLCLVDCKKVIIAKYIE